jgi:hypothetical protein
LDTIRYGFQTADLSVGRVGAGLGAWRLNRPTPGAANVLAQTGNPALLRVNEWMASPAAGDDWFELFNPGAEPVEVSGLYVTDDLNQRTQHALAPLSFVGTLPHDFVQLVADSNPAAGAIHVNFKLAADGESLGLFTATGTLVDAIRFGTQVKGVSEGRLPDGAATIVAFPKSPSPGAGNHLPIENDVDSDGMADDWERANQLNPGDPTDAALDPDHDGLTNLEEFLAGTKPQDPQSTLRFSEAVPSGDGLTLRFNAIAGHTYTVQYRGRLDDAGWRKLGDVSAMRCDCVAEVTDSQPETDGERYYRIVTPAEP